MMITQFIYSYVDLNRIGVWEWSKLGTLIIMVIDWLALHMLNH